MSDIIILRENGKDREISSDELDELKKQQPKIALTEVDKGHFVKLEKLKG